MPRNPGWPARRSGIRRCRATPRIVLMLRPDIVVAGAYDKRATRELLKQQGVRLVELRRVPRIARRGERPDPRDGRHSPAIPIAPRAEIARLDAAIARARAAVARQAFPGAAAVAARLGVGAGQPDQSAVRRNRPGQCRGRSRHRLGRLCLAGGDRQGEAGSDPGRRRRRLRRGRRHARSCCIRRWSDSIRRRNASSFRNG